MGAVAADKLRRFRADFIKNDTAVGFGIVEYGAGWESEVIAIQSIFEPKRISTRDATVNILQALYNDLADDEGAVLQMNKFSARKGFQKPYASRINAQYRNNRRGTIYQASLLAGDALRRGTTVSEIFEEPMRFRIIEQEEMES